MGIRRNIFIQSFKICVGQCMPAHSLPQFSSKLNTIIEINIGISVSMIGKRFKGYRCESGIPIYKEWVTEDYAYGTIP